jgi:hypothetical protein
MSSSSSIVWWGLAGPSRSLRAWFPAAGRPGAPDVTSGQGAGRPRPAFLQLRWPRSLRHRRSAVPHHSPHSRSAELQIDDGSLRGSVRLQTRRVEALAVSTLPKRPDWLRGGGPRARAGFAAVGPGDPSMRSVGIRPRRRREKVLSMTLVSETPRRAAIRAADEAHRVSAPVAGHAAGGPHTLVRALATSARAPGASWPSRGPRRLPRPAGSREGTARARRWQRARSVSRSGAGRAPGGWKSSDRCCRGPEPSRLATRRSVASVGDSRRSDSPSSVPVIAGKTTAAIAPSATRDVERVGELRGAEPDPSVAPGTERERGSGHRLPQPTPELIRALVEPLGQVREQLASSRTEPDAGPSGRPHDPRGVSTLLRDGSMAARVYPRLGLPRGLADGMVWR